MTALAARPRLRSPVRIDSTAGDVALVAAMFCAVVVEALLASPADNVPAVLGGAALVALPIGWRRREPTLAMVAYSAGATLFGYAISEPYHMGSLHFALAGMSYSAGRHERGEFLDWRLIAVVIAAFPVSAALDHNDWVIPGVLLGLLPWLGGRVLRERAQLNRALAAHAERVQAQRAQHPHDAVEEERRRIARDLHDAVAHGLTVMTLQAAGARSILRSDPQRAAESASHVEHTGEQAMAEMRRLVSVVTPDAPASRTPQPGLDEIEALVDSARAAGIKVEVRREGDLSALPAGIGVTAYRVAQEALTNVLKHGSADTAELVVRLSDRELEVSVTNPGGSRRAPGGGTGRGLRGLRERVTVYGGHLESGPDGRGGFAVRAILPLRS